MQDKINSEVLNFTRRFTLNGQFDQVITAFTCGCCFWFAQILFERFDEYHPTIMYDEVINHFGTRIGSRVFDISGDVTDDYHWIDFADLDDELLRGRIIRDCVMFEK